MVEPKGEVLTGLDVLAQENFAPLAGKRIGLITNHTGLSRDGKRNIDLMLAAGIKIVAVFSPEHGLTGTEDQENVADTKDSATGLPVISLYAGPTRRLTPQMLAGVDALVFDIQDVGARFYTYSCTMLSSMEEAAKKHLPFYLLDRPNPITGVHVEGPVLDRDLESFVGCLEIPLRHGMTFGELANMANSERKSWTGSARDCHARLGSRRLVRFHRLALGQSFAQYAKSQCSHSLSRRCHAGIFQELFRGPRHGRPFEQVGADWIHGRELAAFLNGRYIPGVRVYPTRFRPTSSNFAGQLIEGVRFVVTDRNAFDSTRLGLELGYAFEKLYPGKIPWDVNRFLIGDHEVIAAGKNANDPRTTVQKMQDALAAFVKRREKYLLYK